MTRRDLAAEIALALLCAERCPAWRWPLVAHAWRLALVVLDAVIAWGEATTEGSEGT